MAKLPEWLEEQLRRQEEERRRMIQRRYEPIKAEAPPLIPPVKRHSSNPIAGLGRAEIERILRQEGWKPTVSAPRNVIDYQKAGNRILLYPDEADKITIKQLRYLMDTPIERRTFVWWQIEGNPSSNPDRISALERTDEILRGERRAERIRTLNLFEGNIARAHQEEVQAARLYDALASEASYLGMEEAAGILMGASSDESRHYNQFDRILIMIAAKKKEMGI